MLHTAFDLPQIQATPDPLQNSRADVSSDGRRPKVLPGVPTNHQLGAQILTSGFGVAFAARRGRLLVSVRRHGAPLGHPFRPTTFEPNRVEPALSQQGHGFVGEEAVRAPAIRHDALVARQVL